MKSKLLIFLALALLAAPVSAQHKKHHKKAKPKTELVSRTDDHSAAWADSVMRTMTLEEQVGQLMMLRVPLQLGKKEMDEYLKKIEKYKVGGVCFFAGTSEKQLEQTRAFQKAAKLPLMVAIDAENGLGMRLKDCYAFPKQMLMGAMPTQYDKLIMEMGQEIGKQCHNMGVHVNFAPVVDLNSNPKNPVIGVRSFGENRERASHKGIAYMKGLQKQHTVAVAKHFPGHGDTESDSHLDLPVIRHSKEYMDSVDLYPFKALIKAGVQGVMSAHLQVDAYDNTKNRPSSLSEKTIDQLLRKQLGFDGLVFTDGMDMKGVTKYYTDGEGELQAMKAGNDVLLLPPDVEKAVGKIVAAAKKDENVRKLVQQHCRRVLIAKYRCGLNKMNADKLHAPTKADAAKCDSITFQMALHGITLIKNEGVLPLKAGEQLDTTKCMVLYASPYVMMRRLKDVNNAKAVVLAYEDHPAIRRAVTELIYGRAPFEGTLPVTAGPYKEGYGLSFDITPKVTPYDRVAAAGMDSNCFKKIDSVALMGIEKKAYPGCQIVVAKGGKIVYNRAYGRQTYDPSSAATDTNTVYDLASLTKACATTFAVMRLVDQGKLSVDDKLSTYLPYLKHTNKKNITVKEAMSHYARLKEFDNYWKKAKDEEDPYMSVMKQIAKSDLLKEQKYVYSDLGFILMGDLVRMVSGQTLDHYVAKYFYQPMGLKLTTYCPLEHGVDLSRIAPTENDTYYRNRQVHGTVHDQNADVMGGVSGHAGLFSTGAEVATLYMMLLNGGEWEGRKYLSPEVIGTFNSRHYAEKGNRRGLGFDKPLFNPTKNGTTAAEVSQESFGHTGFTGTMVWADPKQELVYVFLSNRVYPDATPNKLAQMNIRTVIQSYIYQSIKKK